MNDTLIKSYNNNNYLYNNNNLFVYNNIKGNNDNIEVNGNNNNFNIKKRVNYNINNEDLVKLNMLNENVNNSRNLYKYDNIVINGDNNIIYEVNKFINNVKLNWVKLDVMVWNMQSANENDIERRKKYDFIREYIRKCNPEFIFIIDMGDKVKDYQIANYRIIHDGRSCVCIRSDIKNEVYLEEGIFRVKGCDLNFVYVRPQEKNLKLVDKIKEIITKYTVIGDLNLRSNIDIKSKTIGKIILGEDSLQTILVSNKGKGIEAFLNIGPSDHNLVIFRCKRRLLHSSQLRLEDIKLGNVKDIIRQIFNEGSFKCELTISQNKKLMGYNEENFLREKIVDDFMENDVKSAFKKYSYLWKQFKKEPFLGTYISKPVEDSLCDHYRHNVNKTYQNIDLIDMNLIDTDKKSFSNAKCNEGIKLKDIDEALSDVWEEIIEENKMNEAIKNFIKYCNASKDNICFKTFFLRKNKILKTFNDIRIISICPIQIKIWEDLIYDRVVHYLSKIIDSLGIYQYGGKPEGSTYLAFFNVQSSYIENDGIGCVFIDLIKGYDCVEWKILENDISKINDNKIRNMLEVWTKLVENCDVLANNTRIKKSRGLGMGLSLAPIIFEYYCHCALIMEKVDIKFLTMYIDDLALIINKIDTGLNELNKIRTGFENRGLLFNMKKSCVITNNEELKEKCKDLNLECKCEEKYLGVIFALDNNNTIITDNRYLKLSIAYNCIPKFICFLIRKRIIEGAILARIRFTAMMHSLKSKLERGKIIRFIWKMFSCDIYKLSYIQLILFMFNFAKFCFDINDIKEINKMVSVFEENDRILKAKEIIKSKLLTGIEQWDEIIENTELEIDDPINWSFNMLFMKSFTSNIWKNVKKGAMTTWRRHKEELRDLPDEIEDILDSKYYKNFKIVQSIILRHLDLKKFDWIIFIIIIFKNFEFWLIKSPKEYVLQSFDFNFPYEVISNERMWIEIMNVYYDFLDKVIILIINNNDKKIKNKIKYILFVLDEFAYSNINYKLCVNDLLIKIKMKLNLHESYLEKLSKFDDNTDYSAYYETIYSSPEELNYVISVDGSFSNNKSGGGIVVRHKTNNMFIEKYFYMKINGEEYIDSRNISGELLSLIFGLEYAIKNKWKTINVIFDYLGVCLFAIGKWRSPKSWIKSFRNKFIKLISENKIKINWLKVFSHSSVRLNDKADQLAKMGCEIIKPSKMDCCIAQPLLE